MVEPGLGAQCVWVLSTTHLLAQDQDLQVQLPGLLVTPLFPEHLWGFVAGFQRVRWVSPSTRSLISRICRHSGSASL